MKITKLSPKHEIYFGMFDSQYDLTSTMIRMQEYYESDCDSFRNQFFTLDQYMDWYAQTHDNKFTYFTDWSGFNIPGEVIKKWYSLFCVAGLRQKEFGLCQNLPLEYDEDKKWYFIATHNDAGDSTFDHEIAHALWYLNDEYKAACLKLLDEVPCVIIEALASWIKTKGYGENVIQDELNAYLSTSSVEVISRRINYMPIHVKQVCETFSNNFKLYAKDLR